MRMKAKRLVSFLLMLILVINLVSGVIVPVGAADSNVYKNKVISILGDSISTYAGYIPVADGFNATHKARYPLGDVTSVEQTWWDQVIDNLGAKLGINDSWRGTSVYNDTEADVSGNYGKKATLSSPTRVQNLGSNGTPDVILFFGGVNDVRRNTPLGSFAAAAAPTVDNVDLTNAIFDTVVDGYQTTIARMKHYYPDAQILAILPTPNGEEELASVYPDRVKTYNAQFKEICNHYDVPYVDLSTMDIGLHTDGIHPTAAGMTTIANAVTEKLKEIDTTLAVGKHAVYKISHDLTKATASKGHYTGVDSGKTFEETITLADENTQITVFMNGKVVENAYEDGKVTIANVTGPLYITDSINVASGGVIVDKSALVMGSDGTYTIDLSGFVTGQTTQAQYSTAAPLDIVLVLDASSSMGQFPNPASGYHTAKAELWEVTRGYPANTTKDDNLWFKFRRSTHYFDANGDLTSRDSVAGSILIPVKPGDHIYCSSFKSSAVTGGDSNGIRVTFFNEDGTFNRSWSASNVYNRFRSGNEKYITVPAGVYAMCVPLWENDAEKVIKNLSISTDNPASGYSDAKAVKWVGTYSAYADATTNLWDKVPLSTKYYNESFELTTRSTVAGSILIPVKPGDHIYCSSFKDQTTTGGEANGVRVTYFDEDGMAIQSLGPTAVYHEFTTNNSEYIVVPDGVYGMNIPMWAGDTEATIKNLSLSAANPADGYDAVYAHGWEETYPTNAKQATNLWNVFTPKEGKYYNASGVIDTSSYLAGSILIPVKPGDHIYCSSFNGKATTGGNSDGIRVTYFGEDGNRLSTLGYEDVYSQFQATEYEYIVVPEGAYAMNVPLWKNDAKKVIKNLSLEYRYNPNTEEEFNSMRAKVLQAQLQKFADALAENAIATGQEHKLAIVTYGGGDGDMSVSLKAQGMFYDHNAVNGFYGITFANTGLFVDGQFKNFISSATAETYNTARNHYEPIFQAMLDTTKTYYYLETALYSETYLNYGAGQMRQAKYDTDQKRWEDKDTGEAVTPRATPYDSNSNVLFMTVTSKTPATLKTADYRDALTSIAVNGAINPDIQFAVDRYVSRGTTHTKYGLQMAANVLNQNGVRFSTDELNVEHKGEQIVILFTDGETDDNEKMDTNGDGVADTNTYDGIFYYATMIKQRFGAKLYTVSVAKEANKRWMDQISSNCPDQTKYDATKAKTNGEYYINVGDMSELEMAFSSITNDLQISRTNVNLDDNAVMQDYLGHDFEMPENFGFGNISVSTVGVTTADDATYSEIPGSEVVYTYDAAAADGTYTNGAETLKVSFDRQEKRVAVTGFNYEDNYVAKNHDGKKLVVKIAGVEVCTTVNTDVLVDTNDTNSGIAYTKSNGEIGIHAFGFPKTLVNSEIYIVDYGKPMTLNPGDWNSSLVGIDAGATLNTTHTTDGTVATNYGAFSMKDGNLVYTPANMKWDGPAVAFALGKSSAVPEDVTTGEYMWTKITVIPANNIYYEDDFTGIDYTGNWVTDGSTQKDVEHPEGAAGDEEGIHGWEEGLKDLQYSDGSAHKAVVNGTNMAEVKFSFTGEGVDIYSFTTSITGTVVATLRGGKYIEDPKYGGYYEVSKTQIVDNQSVSGDYYQIPTLSFMDLTYGTYEVTIYVTTAAKDRFDYYLDGVRVYRPLEDDVNYSEDEQFATFTEIRDLLAKPDENSKNGGAVFIDKTAGEGDNIIGVAKPYDTTEYGMYGPKNEVYLAGKKLNAETQAYDYQSITFKVGSSDGASYYYVGLKAPEGSGNAVVLISNGNDTKREITVDHSTDMYYRAIPDSDGYITIENSGDCLLSITKLRIAGSAEGAQISPISEDEAVFAVNRFSLRPLASNAVVPEEPENPEVPEVPGGDVPDVPENPENPEVPGDDTPDDTEIPETGDADIFVLTSVMLGGMLLTALLLIMLKRRDVYEA